MSPIELKANGLVDRSTLEPFRRQFHPPIKWLTPLTMPGSPGTCQIVGIPQLGDDLHPPPD